MKMRRKLGHNFLILFLVYQTTHSSPVSRSSRMVREVYPDDQPEQAITNPIENGNQAKEPLSNSDVILALMENLCIVGDVVYGVGESVPSEQPCLKCTCDAPSVNCETVICQQQPGCKAIHRPNKCCPDYQCECQHEGKTYANGERLPSANGSECHVCYCRGGEVQCAEVGCYTRDDCEPSYIPGQCCPRYDHCPPKEPLADRIQVTTESSSTPKKTESWKPWSGSSLEPITGAPVIGQFLTRTTVQAERTSQPPSTFENEGSGDDTTEFLPILNNNEIKSEAPPAVFSIKEIESKKRAETSKVEPSTIKIDKGTQTDPDRPKITIQEVIPQQKEIQITSAPKDLSTRSPIKIIEDSSNELVDSQSYASEKTEVYNHPPPVLRIGDQLLFFKQGQLVHEKDASTPSPVITLIGAEGLQIGLGSEEMVEHDLIPTNNEAKKVEEELQDISGRNSEDSTGTPNSEPCSEEYIILPEESKIVEFSTTEPPKTIPTTLSSLEVKIPDVPNSVRMAKPIKRDQEISTTKPEAPTSIPEEKTEVSKTPTSTEFIPEENPYYPPIPEELLTPEDHETKEEKKEPEITTYKPEIDSVDNIEIVHDVPKKFFHTTQAPLELKTLQEKAIKELKNEGRLDELMLHDAPITDESESESAEETTGKKLVDVTSKSQESTEKASEEVTSRKETTVHLEDPEVSSEEPSSEEQKDQPQKDEEDSKLLPEVIPLLSNKTYPSSTQNPIDWLKTDSTKKPDTKVSPVLINEKASLPKEMLESTHETDALEDLEEGTTKPPEKDESSSSSSEESAETTTPKEEPTKIDLFTREKKDNSFTEKELIGTTKVAEVIVEKVTEVNMESKSPEVFEAKSKTKEGFTDKDTSVTKITTELESEEKSKETVETSEETSKEVTTSRGEHSNMMADDASVEIGKESQSQINTEELVETIPGFEPTTVKFEKVSSEESSEELYGRINPKSEVEVLVTQGPPEEKTQKTEEGSSPVEVTTRVVEEPKEATKAPAEQKEPTKSPDPTKPPVEHKKHDKHHHKVTKGVAPNLGVIPLSVLEKTDDHKRVIKDDKHKEELPHEVLSSKNGTIDQKPKRDVVKKVLKENFENPTENIQTELKDDAPPRIIEEIIHEHDLAEQREEEMGSQEVEKTAESEFDSEVKIEDDFGDNPTKIQKTPLPSTDQKSTEVIQRIGDVRKLRESTEALDTSLLGIFRDFISKNHQLKYASNEEKV